MCGETGSTRDVYTIGKSDMNKMEVGDIACYENNKTVVTSIEDLPQSFSSAIVNPDRRTLTCIKHDMKSEKGDVSFVTEDDRGFSDLYKIVGSVVL